MYELLFSTGINILMQVLRIAIKNPEKAAKYRDSMLMVRDAINATYDPGAFEAKHITAADARDVVRQGLWRRDLSSGRS